MTMDYNIKFQPYNNLYYARIPDGSKYGRKVQAKTKQALMDKLKNLWVMPSKQTKNAMTVGDAIHTFENYIDFNFERPGADLRYSIDDSKLRSLGWEPKADFDNELGEIVQYYKDNFIW